MTAHRLLDSVGISGELPRQGVLVLARPTTTRSERGIVKSAKDAPGTACNARQTPAAAGKTKSRTQWRRAGRGIKPRQEPVETFCYRKKPTNLYSFEQTSQLRPYTIARNHLLDLFVDYPERFGFRTKEKNTITQVISESILGGAHRLIERGWNYRACRKGIRIGNSLAESFHVPAGTSTRVGVLDLDIHGPVTRRSLSTHLELVERVQNSLPGLVNALGGGSSFFQYRQIEPTGIQAWIVTRVHRRREDLHQTIREFLLSLDTDGLDERLRSAGLPTLANIEILPSEKLVSLPGVYGKSVFTTHELKISDERFDCEGLSAHIRAQLPAGDVFKRYRELSMVRSFSDLSPAQPVRPSLVTAAKSSVANAAAYWSDLKMTALNGVTCPDDLHDKYLEPLAQALLFREFHDAENKKTLAFNSLKAWINKKHNGMSSRINDGNLHLVEDQIRSTIKTLLKKTNKKVLDYYARMRLNDKRFPERVESIVTYMEMPPNTPPSFLIDCKGGFSSENKDRKRSIKKTLPTLLIFSSQLSKRLRDYARDNVRAGKTTKRFLTFSRRFISEIGREGVREISNGRVLQLAGRNRDVDTSFLKKWKIHLVQAGILRKGWEEKIVRGVRCSRYALTKWTISELATANPPEGLQDLQ